MFLAVLGVEASLPSMRGKHTVLTAQSTDVMETCTQLEQSCSSVCHVGCVQDACVTDRHTLNSRAAPQIHLKLHG